MRALTSAPSSFQGRSFSILQLRLKPRELKLKLLKLEIAGLELAVLSLQRGDPIAQLRHLGQTLADAAHAIANLAQHAHHRRQQALDLWAHGTKHAGLIEHQQQQRQQHQGDDQRQRSIGRRAGELDRAVAERITH